MKFEVVRRLKTNNVGTANALLLRPGTYEITATAPGFRRLVHKGVTLNVGSTLNPKLALETGGTTQTVTVVGKTLLLQEKSAVLSFRIPVGEATRLNFRAEAFNTLNHPQFGQPGRTIGTAQYGVINGMSIADRQVRLALRLVF